MKTCGTSRAHPEPGGQPMHRNVWNWMVLQRKPHFKNGIVPRSWQISNRWYEFSKWHGVREAIHGCLMHRLWARREGTVCVNLASERDNAGAVAHRFPDRLLGPIRYRGTH